MYDLKNQSIALMILHTMYKIDATALNLEDLTVIINILHFIRAEKAKTGN